MDSEKIMLSVLIPTYNHEKYIVEALDSVLAQKTQYTYEILVGDDCSTDDTQNVLKQYEKEHVNRLQVIYRDHNTSKEAISNGLDLRLRAKGKYCIMLEGDDYWIDPNKLQEQITFLETHPEYVAVAHNCIVVDQNSRPINEEYPQCKDEEYTLKHFSRGILPGQTATVMFKNWIKTPFFDTSLFDKKLSPSDQIMYFSFITHGKIYCIQKVMSAYRHILKGGSSYSANTKADFTRDFEWHRAIMEYSYKIDHPEAERYSEMLLLLSVRHAIISKRISFVEGIKHLACIKHKFRALYDSILRDFERLANRKDIEGYIDE